MSDELKTEIRRLSFMALLTLALVACVQLVSVVAMVRGDLEVRDYLSLWVPMLTMALGYWFGRGEK